jgi:hypothetical protein
VAERRRRADLPGTLFPFLSVLACVIGTLTLLIATVAISSVGTGLLDIARLEALRDDRATAEAELASLEDSAVKARVALAALSDKRSEFAKLGLLELPTPAERERSARLRIEAERLRRDVVAARSERARLSTSLARAKAEFDARSDSTDLRPIQLRPSGSGRDLRPFFIECGSNGLVLHRRGESLPLAMDRGEAIGDAPYVVFLRRVRATPGASVVFMVRPDAVAICLRAEQMAESVGVRQGRLPLPGQGVIDFSLVEEFEP